MNLERQGKEFKSERVNYCLLLLKMELAIFQKIIWQIDFVELRIMLECWSF